MVKWDESRAYLAPDGRHHEVFGRVAVLDQTVREIAVSLASCSAKMHEDMQSSPKGKWTAKGKLTSRMPLTLEYEGGSNPP